MNIRIGFDTDDMVWKVYPLDVSVDQHDQLGLLADNFFDVSAPQKEESHFTFGRESDLIIALMALVSLEAK